MNSHTWSKLHFEPNFQFVPIFIIIIISQYTKMLSNYQFVPTFFINIISIKNKLLNIH